MKWELLLDTRCVQQGADAQGATHWASPNKRTTAKQGADATGPAQARETAVELNFFLGFHKNRTLYLMLAKRC